MTTNQIMSNEITSTSSTTLKSCMSLECDDIKYSFKIKIIYFNECKQELWSQSFNTGLNCKWILYVNPSKYGKDGEEYISLFLNLAASDQNSVLAKFKIGLIDNMDELKYCKHIEDHEFKPGTDWGWSQFLKKSLILDQQNDLIDWTKDNMLTVFCEIILGKVTTDSNEESKEVMDCNLLKEFTNMFSDKDFADIKILVNNKEFTAHKIVLTSRSAVFMNLIKSADKENQSVLKLKDIDEDIFEEVLKFIYTGKTFDEYNDKIEKLFVAAQEFGIKQLKNITQELIYLNLSHETAINVLLFADANNAIHLKEKAIKYIACNHPYVKRASLGDWVDFIEEQPELVMQVFDALAQKYHINQ